MIDGPWKWCCGWMYSLQWRQNEGDGVLNQQLHDCLVNRLIRRRIKKTSKLRVIGFCVGNSPVTGEFPSQRAINAGHVSIWWRHHVKYAVNSMNYKIYIKLVSNAGSVICKQILVQVLPRYNPYLGTLLVRLWEHLTNLKITFWKRLISQVMHKSKRYIFAFCIRIRRCIKWLIVSALSIVISHHPTLGVCVESYLDSYLEINITANKCKKYLFDVTRCLGAIAGTTILLRYNLVKCLQLI